MIDLLELKNQGDRVIITDSSAHKPKKRIRVLSINS